MAEEAVMQVQSNNTYEPEQLAMLTRVLDEALAAIVNCDGPSGRNCPVEELRAHLGKVIIDQFAMGETDPEMLKIIAVNTMRIHNGT
jgi:DNA-directed RNA polymerase alpha subunit